MEWPRSCSALPEHGEQSAAPQTAEPQNAPQQFKGHSLIPSAFLLPGKTEKPFICVKHACHLLLPYPHPSPACGPPTSERRGDTVSTTPHVFPHPGFSLIHHSDLVCIGYGTQAVGDNDKCLSSGQPADGVLKHRLVLGVCVGSRLVQITIGAFFIMARAIATRWRSRRRGVRLRRLPQCHTRDPAP